MGNLTDNISRWETTCKCGCSFDVVDYELLKVVQDTADFFKDKHKSNKVKIIIKSGNRCVNHNRDVGGAVNSQHLTGKALDFILETSDEDGTWFRVSTEDLASYLDVKFHDKYGIGKYPRGRVHLDVRPTKARWIKYD